MGSYEAYASIVNVFTPIYDDDQNEVYVYIFCGFSKEHVAIKFDDIHDVGYVEKDKCINWSYGKITYRTSFGDKFKNKMTLLFFLAYFKWVVDTKKATESQLIVYQRLMKLIS